MTEPSSNAPQAPDDMSKDGDVAGIDTETEAANEKDTATKPLPISTGAQAGHENNAAPDLSEQDIEERLAKESLERNRKKRRKHRIVAIVAAAIVIVAIVVANTIFGTQTTEEGGSTVQTVSVVREDFTNAVTASGNVQPVSSVVVTPEVDGIISEVNVAEGSTVAEGDVLFTIKNDSLDKAVREAQTALDNAKDDVSQAWDSYYAVVDSYYAGEVDYNATVEAADAVDTANEMLESAQETYDEAVATADKRTVRAPAAGSVVVMNAVSGASTTSTSTSGEPLIQIADISQMTVKVSINEVDITKIAEGQTASVTFSALPDVTSDATVTRIATLSSSDGTSDYGGYGASSSVTYSVELLIPQPPENLKPGMTANVEIVLQSVPDALTLPSSCIATDADGSTYVMRAVRGEESVTFERVDVTVVASDSSTSAIEGELEEGDEVALTPDETGGSEGESVEPTVSVSVDASASSTNAEG